MGHREDGSRLAGELTAHDLEILGRHRRCHTHPLAVIAVITVRQARSFAAPGSGLPPRDRYGVEISDQSRAYQAEPPDDPPRVSSPSLVGAGLIGIRYARSPGLT